MTKSDEPDKSGKSSSNVHDRFFKNVFQHVDYVTTLIRVGAPDELFDVIDWSTLSLYSSSLLVPEMTEKFADLVFTVNVKDSGESAQIILLFEHKSYRDIDLVKQLAEYQLRLYVREKFNSLIIPIVVLQGKAGGTTQVEFFDLFSNLSSECLGIFSQYAMNFRCVLIDVDEIDHLGLARKTNIDAVIRSMSQVRGAEPSLLQDIYDRTGYIPSQERARIIGLAFGYVSEYNKDVTLEDIQVDTLEEQLMIQSAAEVLRQEGREEGLEKGLEKGREERSEVVATKMLQKGMDPETVADFTLLSRERILELQRDSEEKSEHQDS